jgi:hypothetical protein
MKKYLLLAALALCLGTLNTPSTQAQANNNTIYACYHKNTGDLRRVSEPGQCKNPEIQISWNVAGIPGPQGIQGEKGDTGPAGPAASGFLTGNIKNLPPPDVNNSGYAAPTGITNLSLTPNPNQEDAWTLSPSETVIFRDFRIKLTKPAVNLYVFNFQAVLPDNNNVADSTLCTVLVGESECTASEPTGPVEPGSKLVIKVITVGSTPDTVDALFSLRATAP